MKIENKLGSTIGEPCIINNLKAILFKQYDAQNSLQTKYFLLNGFLINYCIFFDGNIFEEDSFSHILF